MDIVFVSNYFNHHQKSLSENLYKKSGGSFTFIQTEPMSEERIRLGWKTELPSYVKCSNESPAAYAEAISMINSADVVIMGSAPSKMIRQRIKDRKLTFRYSERIFKKRDIDLLRWLKYYIRSRMEKRGNVYYLCSSAYAPRDYARCGVNPDKCYKWGYFPETKEYEDIDALIEAKVPNSIMWTARMIDWKHPEKAIEVAKRLKADGYSFTLNMIGNGSLENEMRDKVIAEGLCDCVKLLGAMKPEEVRENMEKSEIFLFTSDRNEGWGAVLNESMNSACAVVASHAIGSVPFMIEDGENGYIYKDSDIDDMYLKVKRLLDNGEERKRISKNAYLTMIKEWNAQNAAERLISFAKGVLNGEKSEVLSGPCSRSK